MNTDSQNAARAIQQLCDSLRGQGHEIPNKFGCSREMLDIFIPHYPTALPPKLLDFLELSLPQGYLDVGVLKTAEPNGLLEEQLGAAPFEGNRSHSIFGLGWWTGDSDGDGWFYDLIDNRVLALPVYCGYEDDRESIYKKAYHCFDTLSDWAEFLRQECIQRGWLKTTSG